MAKKETPAPVPEGAVGCLLKNVEAENYGCFWEDFLAVVEELKKLHQDEAQHDYCFAVPPSPKVTAPQKKKLVALTAELRTVTSTRAGWDLSQIMAIVAQIAALIASLKGKKTEEA